ncbi:MAG TPA: EAL domain-containing protein [Sphingomonas sp.]|nr:EAL domain-containing protein [Sphingomonas sp.]
MAEFAPLLAGTATTSAFVLAIVLFPTTKPAYLTLWLLLVVLASGLMVRQVGRSALRHVRLDPSIGTLTKAALFVGLVPALWAAMPVAVFRWQSDHVQTVLIGALCAMMCGSLAIASAPIAATLWAGILAIGLGVALHLDGYGISMPLTGLVLSHFGFLIAVIRRNATLLAERTEQEVRSQFEAEATAQLMREYEERGTSCLWQTDAGHILSYATPGITTLLRRPSARLIGSPLPSLVGGNGALGSALLARAPFSGIEIEVADNNARRTITFAGTPIIDSAGSFLGFRGNCSDVTETRSSERRLRQLVSLDVLTELPNRLRMRELLGEALLAARASGKPCCLLLLDLDGFKPVNDTFGHPKGDALLKTVAERLVVQVGTRGIVGRLGGDEFAVVLHDEPDRHSVADLAELLIRRVSEPYTLDGVSVRIGVSAGGAFGPLDGDTVDDLVKKADMALYEAKAAGRGTYRPFRHTMQTEADNRLKAEHELREALALNQFRLEYQPLIDSRTHQVSGFEALVRWQHPVRGFVPPIDFVPLAEEVGLIHELGEWVVETAIRDCARWPESISVAVNLSPIQLLSSGLPAMIADALAKERLPANRLELEVTESVFLRDTDGSLEVLRRLRALGVRIALDDFGTGYSSLGYLNRTIFNKLKIDGSFVRGAAARPETISIIQAIVTLANSFQMSITAEGVETQDDYRRMADLGCHQMQGYLFGRPVPFERATELVGTHWIDTQALTRV